MKFSRQLKYFIIIHLVLCMVINTLPLHAQVRIYEHKFSIGASAATLNQFKGKFRDYSAFGIAGLNLHWRFEEDVYSKLMYELRLGMQLDRFRIKPTQYHYYNLNAFNVNLLALVNYKTYGEFFIVSLGAGIKYAPGVSTSYGVTNKAPELIKSIDYDIDNDLAIRSAFNHYRPYLNMGIQVRPKLFKNFTFYMNFQPQLNKTTEQDLQPFTYHLDDFNETLHLLMQPLYIELGIAYNLSKGIYD